MKPGDKRKGVPPASRWPGQPYPLGATWDGAGVNFSVFSEHATGVQLCLFDNEDEEIERISLQERTDQAWHVYVPGLRPGMRYAYRVDGPWEPERGHRFNRAKLLIDPYAKAIDRPIRWGDKVFGYRIGGPQADLEPDDRDSAPAVPKCVVSHAEFPWEGDALLRRPWHETIIYEAHVKGLTARHPGVPPELRGTFAGMASPAIIAHLRSLGVTAVELMPVHHFVADRHLVERGLTNYWGYNSIGYFAPDVRYAATGEPGQQVIEFKSMVKQLHRAGIEVILDVVYNHTGEGNHLGPTLSFRGIDNASYYRLSAEDPRYHVDFTGCGNSLNMRHPRVLQLIMDSLRYWVLEMHVDGFRFDLASTLARELHEVDRLGAFFDIIHQDPVLSQVKLIAEPWDLGAGGYQVGNFPVLWSEWNGRYRDTVRDFWRGEPDQLRDLAYRITGSADLYESSGRRPYASINYVTAHDGFTLEDLVSYHQKRNDANGEDGRDGESHNRSWNCGHEGPTDDPAVLALRARQKRNMLATLLLSQGVPMLLAGDEQGRTQRGNNNAFCQDNEISWVEWESVDEALLAFVRRLVRLRQRHPAFRRRRWFQGRHPLVEGGGDIVWFRSDGHPMTEQDWAVGYAKTLTVWLNGQEIPSTGPRGEPISDDRFLLMLNAHHDALDFTLPRTAGARPWRLVFDTASPEAAEGSARLDEGANRRLEAHSLVLMVEEPAG